jgi:hypothetical protein
MKQATNRTQTKGVTKDWLLYGFETVGVASAILLIARTAKLVQDAVHSGVVGSPLTIGALPLVCSVLILLSRTGRKHNEIAGSVLLAVGICYVIWAFGLTGVGN